MGNGFSSRKKSAPTYVAFLLLLKCNRVLAWTDGLGFGYTCADVSGGKKKIARNPTYNLIKGVQ